MSTWSKLCWNKVYLFTKFGSGAWFGFTFGEGEFVENFIFLVPALLTLGTSLKMGKKVLVFTLFPLLRSYFIFSDFINFGVKKRFYERFIKSEK